MRRVGFILVMSLILSSSVLAFDFFGIKSGMTKEEFEGVEKLIKKDKKPYKISNYEAEKINAEYTQQGKLYVLQIYFRKSFNLDEVIALTNALKKVFPNFEIKEESERGTYFTYYYYVVYLMDEKVLNESVKILESEYIEKLKWNNNTQVQGKGKK